MKRHTERSEKMHRLADRLDLPLYAAAGILELLWHACAEQTPRGDIGRMSDRHLARLLDWQGDAAELVAALVETGWLDEHPEHRLLVHDWAQHADRWVARSLANRGLEFIDPDAPQFRAPESAVSGAHTGAHTGAPPRPAPRPRPMPRPRPSEEPGEGNADAPEAGREGEAREADPLEAELAARGVGPNDARWFCAYATPGRIRNVLAVFDGRRARGDPTPDPTGLFRTLIVKHSKPEELTPVGKLDRQTRTRRLG